MAAHLQNLGLQPGDRVAILSKNTAHWLMSDIAIWLAGGASVPLYPTLASGTIRQILEHSESSLLFVGKLDGWDRMRVGVPANVGCISHPLPSDEVKRAYPQWDDIVAKTAPLEGRPVRPDDSLATIIYTSGTTGTQKGVMWSFGAFARHMQPILRRLRSNSSTRLLSYLPLSHIAERVAIEHVQLAVGAHTYFSESLETFSADLQRARPTYFLAVPRLWVKFQQSVLARMPPELLDRLLKAATIESALSQKILTALGLDQCRDAWTGTAPTPPELMRWYAKVGLNINEAYGMTELGATHVTGLAEQAFGTVGRPVDGVECRLDSLSSEIQIRTPWTMLGYYKEPRADSPNGYRRRLGAHRRQGRVRRAGQPDDHRSCEGPLQNQQG
jgi:long-chain acyl-CoA synthetase